MKKVLFLSFLVLFSVNAFAINTKLICSNKTGTKYESSSLGTARACYWAGKFASYRARKCNPGCIDSGLYLKTKSKGYYSALKKGYCTVEAIRFCDYPY